MNNMFFIVGGQRCGTTYLYKMLEQHPEIEMAKPIIPEPKYFLRNKSQIDKNEYINAYYSNPNIEIRGEKSTSYYEYEKSAKNISSYFPDSKIIFVLRNPVKRALSNYFFNVDNNIESRSLKQIFIEEANSLNNININDFSVNPYNYIKRGEYWRFIKKYKKYFTDSNIKIIIFENLINKPSILKDICKYLGTTKKCNFRMNKKVINKSKSKFDHIPLVVIKKLSNYYRPYNRKLEELIGTRINLWK